MKVQPELGKCPIQNWENELLIAFPLIARGLRDSAACP